MIGLVLSGRGECGRDHHRFRTVIVYGDVPTPPWPEQQQSATMYLRRLSDVLHDRG